MTDGFVATKNYGMKHGLVPAYRLQSNVKEHVCLLVNNCFSFFVLMFKSI